MTVSKNSDQKEIEMVNESEKCPGDLQSEELNTWISTIPFSKPKKNLTRDFSDAVLMAEVLKVYYPRFVDLHNYVPTSSVNTKKENWNILNRKVLGKIDMKLSKEMINQLANSQSGAAEHVLMELRSKVLRNPEHSQNLVFSEKERDSAEEGKLEEADEKAGGENVNSPPPTNASMPKAVNSKTSIFIRAWRRLCLALYWTISWFYVWTYFSKVESKWSENSVINSRKEDADASRTRRTPENMNEEDEGTVPRHVCVQLKQELLEKVDIICTLNHKVAYLESAVKLRDLKISNLSAQILQNAVESEQAGKVQVSNDAHSKARPRPQTVPEKSRVEE